MGRGKEKNRIPMRNFEPLSQLFLKPANPAKSAPYAKQFPFYINSSLVSLYFHRSPLES